MWLEDMLMPGNFRQDRELAVSTSLPLTIGERMAGKLRFEQLLESKAAKYILFDACWCGGFTEARKTAAMAGAGALSRSAAERMLDHRDDIASHVARGIGILAAVELAGRQVLAAAKSEFTVAPELTRVRRDSLNVRQDRLRQSLAMIQQRLADIMDPRALDAR